jgi:hypothetical protein
MQAILRLTLVLDFETEYEYAQKLIETIDRARELGTIETYSVGRRRAGTTVEEPAP